MVLCTFSFSLFTVLSIFDSFLFRNGSKHSL